MVDILIGYVIITMLIEKRENIMIAQNIFKEIILNHYYSVVDAIDGIAFNEAEYNLEVKRRVYNLVNPANQKTAEVFNKLYDELVAEIV